MAQGSPTLGKRHREEENGGGDEDEDEREDENDDEVSGKDEGSLLRGRGQHQAGAEEEHAKNTVKYNDLTRKEQDVYMIAEKVVKRAKGRQQDVDELYLTLIQQGFRSLKMLRNMHKWPVEQGLVMEKFRGFPLTISSMTEIVSKARKATQYDQPKKQRKQDLNGYEKEDAMEEKESAPDADYLEEGSRGGGTGGKSRGHYEMLEDRDHPKLIGHQCANTQSLKISGQEIKPRNLWAAVRRTAPCAASSPLPPLPYTCCCLFVYTDAGGAGGRKALSVSILHPVHSCYKRAVHAWYLIAQHSPHMTRLGARRQEAHHRRQLEAPGPGKSRHGKGHIHAGC